MFFILSKILQFVISPIVWLFCLLLWAVITKNTRRSKKLIITSAILLYLFSNGFIFDEAIRAWETRQSNIINNNKTYNYAIVLGGFVNSYEIKTEQLGFNRGVDRLMQAIKLYKIGKVKKIVFTGGDASIVGSYGNEGNIIKNFINQTKIIDTADFIVENSSRNTHENALYIAKLFKSGSLKGNALLITSAFHMKRALGCFKKTGLNVDYYVADRYSGKRKYIFDHLLIPNSDTFDKWNLLIHEIVGYYVYSVVGYS